MNNCSVLDCTLRDGAYLLDKEFRDNNIKGIIDGLIQSNVDIIEIGFLQDEGFGPDKVVYKDGKDAKRFVPKNKGKSMMTAFADLSRYSISNLDNNTGDTFDAVRACFFKHERHGVFEYAKTIIEKGYKVFIQPVDILGYSDSELIELIESINSLEPYCFSIVDTFGSMYLDDLRRVYEIINRNLVSSCRIGFHSHNNLQMSNALSQEFVSLLQGNRKGVVDSTLSGMGRGAGNTPTELIVQYLNSKKGYNYDMDVILRIIEQYMDNIRTRCTWGYDTNLFLAGCYSAHVNNVSYLSKKPDINYRDIRHILSAMTPQKRKRYYYDDLDALYLECVQSDICDSEAIGQLKEKLCGKDILLLAPGTTCITEKNRIEDYCQKVNPIIISANHINPDFRIDYFFCSNPNRLEYWKKNPLIDSVKKIVVSSVDASGLENCCSVSLIRLVKKERGHGHNSITLLLRLLDELDVRSIAIAGMDGFNSTYEGNYVIKDLESLKASSDPSRSNEEIKAMLIDYKESRQSSANVSFVTSSRFKDVFP